MRQLAALTALTALHLHGIIHDQEADIRPVQKIGLIELKLRHCLGVAEALLVPGALPALEDLSLYEYNSMILGDEEGVVDIEGAPEVIQEAAAAKAEELGRVVFGHPSLVKLSGACRFFSLDIPDKSRYWQRCPPLGTARQFWRKIV